MVDFFKQLDYETAVEVEGLTRLMYELREHRNDLLASCAVADEAALLEQIAACAVAEHPAYEQYLASRILADTCETARLLVAEKLREAQRS
jgi:hypothetical protein